MDFADDLANIVHDDYNHRNTTHNIFDISAHYNSHFNSSIRYDPFPQNNFTRHTPSPHHNHHHSRSRSPSRPPSSSSGPGAVRNTTRSRRNNSISGTSPPPNSRPHAILIPGPPHHHRPQLSMSTLGPASPLNTAPHPSNWFNDYSLPTPDSLHSHSHIQNYNAFSLHDTNPSSVSSSGTTNNNNNTSTSPPHLPPLHHNNNHHHPHHHHHHHHSLSSAPLISSLVNSGFAVGSFTLTPPGTAPSLPPLAGSLPTSSGLASPVSPTLAGMGTMSLTSPLNGTHPPPPPPVSQQDKQAQLANEKRRRRRESHNAVERRRRDNINEKISELATLIPECMLDVAAANNPSPLTDDPMIPVDAKKDETTPSGTPTSPTINTTTTNGNGNGSGNEVEGGVVKANKGMILRKSVEYIRYLQQLVTAQGARNRELELELKAYRSQQESAGGNTGEEEGMVLHDEQFGYAPFGLGGVPEEGGGVGVQGVPMDEEEEGEEEGRKNVGADGDGDGEEWEGMRGRTRGRVGLGVKEEGEI